MWGVLCTATYPAWTPRSRRDEEMKTMAKAKAKTGNPFLDADLGGVMDFGKFAEQF